MEVLKTMIYPQLNDFDYVLIDCPPNLGFITRNGIEISDYYLIPTIPDTLSASGIPQIVKSIRGFKLERLLKIECLGLLITKYTSNSGTHKKAKSDLTYNFKKVFTDLEIPSPTIFETHRHLRHLKKNTGDLHLEIFIYMNMSQN
jgi:chromosome partitioning protein